MQEDICNCIVYHNESTSKIKNSLKSFSHYRGLIIFRYFGRSTPFPLINNERHLVNIFVCTFLKFSVVTVICISSRVNDFKKYEDKSCIQFGSEEARLFFRVKMTVASLSVSLKWERRLAMTSLACWCSSMAAFLSLNYFP